MRRAIRSRSWPQSLKGMNNIIKRLTPNFRKMGIGITKLDSHGREYILETIELYPPNAPQAHNNKQESSTSRADSADGADKSQEFQFDEDFVKRHKEVF